MPSAYERPQRSCEHVSLVSPFRYNSIARLRDNVGTASLQASQHFISRYPGERWVKSHKSTYRHVDKISPRTVGEFNGLHALVRNLT